MEFLRSFLRSHYSHLTEKPVVTSLIAAVFSLFSNWRLCSGIEIVFCRLLLRMARIDVDWNLKMLNQIFMFIWCYSALTPNITRPFENRVPGYSPEWILQLFVFRRIANFSSVHFVREWRWLSSFPATLVPARAVKPCPCRRLCLRIWKVSINELVPLTTHPASFIASVTFPIASSIMSTMPAWVRLALLRIPRYFSSYFRSTLNGPCTLWNGRYKNKGLDVLCDRITLLACCLIEKETKS